MWTGGKRLLGASVALLVVTVGAMPAAAGLTTRVSVDSAGNQANGGSFAPAISADGRFVAFHSVATDLVGGDTNGVGDIFVHDRQTGLTTRVSVDSVGNQANGDSNFAAISADGRFVAFHSVATNLLGAGVDTNGTTDIFVHDLQTGLTTRVSVDSAGNQANDHSVLAAISADGRFVAFESFATNLLGVGGDTNGVWDVFVHDRQTGLTTRVSVDSAGNQANSDSHLPAISADGRFVAFHSVATNLVGAGVDTNGTTDVFVHDRLPPIVSPPVQAKFFFTTSLGNDQILKYDARTGAFLGSFVTPGSGGLDSPRGFAFGPDGDLYVASQQFAAVDPGLTFQGAILRYSGADGSFRSVFAAPVLPPFTGALFDLVFGPDGHLYVSTCNSVKRFQRRDRSVVGLSSHPNRPLRASALGWPSARTGTSTW